MAQIHQLLIEHGLDKARAATSSELDRRCLDAAFAVMSDDEQRIGVTHAGFAMTALPHKAVPDETWVRQGANIKLRIDAGRSADDKLVGLPYGAIARLILLYLQTEAVRTKSREIELGRSMNSWLARLGLDDGGKNYRLVREQSHRLSLCRLTFYRITESATFIRNSSFVSDAIIPACSDDQLQLWHDSVCLDEGFYKSLVEHPLPLREAAIRQISHRSMAIDVYLWLAYRLHQLSKPTPITWKALYEQFGAGFKLLRQFRARFKEPLALALAAYPEARVDIDDVGVVLHPAAPPVPERARLSVTRVRTG